MATVSSLDNFLDPANGWLTPQVAQRIVDWHPDEALRKRIEELGRKAKSLRCRVQASFYGLSQFSIWIEFIFGYV
jgi:hypothetical protein